MIKYFDMNQASKFCPPPGTGDSRCHISVLKRVKSDQSRLDAESDDENANWSTPGGKFDSPYRDTRRANRSLFDDV